MSHDKHKTSMTLPAGSVPTTNSEAVPPCLSPPYFAAASPAAMKQFSHSQNPLSSHRTRCTYLTFPPRERQKHAQLRQAQGKRTHHSQFHTQGKRTQSIIPFRAIPLPKSTGTASLSTYNSAGRLMLFHSFTGLKAIIL